MSFLDKVLVSLVILRLSGAKAAKIANAATLPLEDATVGLFGSLDGAINCVTSGVVPSCVRWCAYGVLPRIEAGWPGSASGVPTATSLSPST
jgi:hypothetical protein